MFIYGASGHGKVVFEIAEALRLTVDLFVDENIELTKVFDIPVVSKVPNQLIEGVLAIGSNQIRKKLAADYCNLNFLSLVHPTANISKRVAIGSGSVIMSGVTISNQVQIGCHAIINTNASIDHDCFLESYVHISPNVALAGNVKIGEGTHVGIGSSIIQGISIGKWATIGAGAVIIRDVPDYAVVVGNPGRIIKYNYEK
jgi:sugar O-acyltransferase (sialic acid O-acetyltransferase NeuD family)